MNKIHLSHEAQSDLEEIKRYISKELENPNAAINTTKGITQTMRILQTYAEAGALLSSIADADDTCGMMMWTPRTIWNRYWN